MKLDAIAREGHFVDHALPVWLALPPEVRGTFYLLAGRDRPEVPNRRRGQPPRSNVPTLTASAGDLVFSRKLGRPTAIMEHGCGQSFGGDPRRGSHSSYAGGVARDAQLFLHPGPHPAARDRAVHPVARVEIVGCPKLDALPRKPERDRISVVCVSFHWDSRVCLETRSAWREFDDQLALLAVAPGLKVIGHGHPRIIDTLARRYAVHGIETVRTFEEVCRRADVYVNDASSTLFEFAATGRPVVVLNASFYRRSINHGLRFWEAATVGVQVTAATERRLTPSLVDAVRRALADPPAQRAAREAALGLVYAYRSGGAERAAAVLMDWAG